VTDVLEHRKPVRLAKEALTAAIDGRWKKAAGYVQRINDECGASTLPYALMCWCDCLAMHATDGQPIPQVGAVQVVAYETGTLTDDDDVPPRVDWARKVVKARAGLDEDTFRGLVDDLNRIDDDHTRGGYVGAVLESAALSIRAFPRGYALMGRNRG
jgi:hypothetical protein